MRTITLILVILGSSLSPLAAFTPSPLGKVRVAGFLESPSPSSFQIQQYPNDPRFFSQWYLSRIRAPAAWDKTVGAASTLIAVVDTGINFSHEDLKDRLWVNSDEIPNNSLDDDRNGYIDDYNGFNFLEGNHDLSDLNGHGSGIASLIAAATNNGVGMAGLNWRAPLMILKALNSAGSGDYSTVAMAIRYAADNGAKVINMSFGTETDSSVLRQAVDYAVDKGVLVVAAAGNGRGPVYFPAAYEKVIAVGSIDRYDQKPSFANFGYGLDLVAPGVDILVADNRGSSSYALASGTSFSAAQVSGVVSLLLALRSLDGGAALSLLRNTADNLGDSLLFGSGVVNADQAVSALYSTAPLSAEVSLSAERAPADGIRTIQATMTLKDGGMLFGQEVSVAVEGENNILNQRLVAPAQTVQLGVTNSLGMISFSLASTAAGRKKVTVKNQHQTITEFFVEFQAITPRWQAQWVGQSAYPTLNLNDETILTLQLRNTGNVAWLGEGASLRGQVRLGTDRRRDRVSRLATTTWLTPNRPAVVSPAIVLPGEIGNFTFKIKASAAGRFREYFRPLAEYLAWMNDLGIYWDITVNPVSAYSAKLVSQGSVAAGDQVFFWADLKNTGTATWLKQGSGIGEVRLGTTDPQDHPSLWFSSTWLSANRAAALPQEVPPGSVGRFAFTVHRSTSTSQSENFRLVAEYLTWFGGTLTFVLP